MPDDIWNIIIEEYLGYRSQLALSGTCKKLNMITSAITRVTAKDVLKYMLLGARELQEEIINYRLRLMTIHDAVVFFPLTHSFFNVAARWKALWSNISYIKQVSLVIYKCILESGQHYKKYLPKLEMMDKKFDKVSNNICSFGMDVQEFEDEFCEYL